jgi:hypothetical protein
VRVHYNAAAGGGSTAAATAAGGGSAAAAAVAGAAAGAGAARHYEWIDKDSDRIDQSRVDPEDCRFHMFLARVCLGSSHATDIPMQGIRRPPIMEQIVGRAHDSIHFRKKLDPQQPACFCKKLDPHHHYEEFVVYEQMQAYPEYLVEFVRQKRLA